MKLKVVTRGSALALWQTEWVIRQLRTLHGAGLEVEILTVKTRGDRVQNVPIAEIGGKGIFVKEVEDALLSGAADFGVHSLKDLPAEQPPGLCLAAIPLREDPRDALVLPEGRVESSVLGVTEGKASSESDTHHPTPITQHLSSLPHGAAVGTTSRRRGALLLHERPDLQIRMLRGNLDTRLRKLDACEYDAAVLAAAGLRRLGYANRLSQLLPVDHFVPCSGQGALAIEAREGDIAILRLLQPLEHPQTRECVEVERTVLRRLGASCTTPLGVHAEIDGDRILLHAMLASLDGADLVRLSTHAATGDPEAAGHFLADRLIDAGGDRVLASLTSGIAQD